ncbi:hypothetical protein CEP51_006522 [Fusarium floridanum]|uniref:Uncharacterized protein n=1 Tax=Fusarium floridanum TaxID=1325733 RepID=A0A428RSL4_9HYPO|nr:hypothetical protein CEP51_006522 [Fusarium floridanum]
MAASAAGGDVFLLYRYDPSMGAAAIFIVLFIAITGLHVYQFVMTKTLFFAWFVVGGFMQIIGYIGASGGIMASGGLEALHNGERIIIVGLVIQLVFFSLFATTASVFHARFAGTLSTKAMASGIPWQSYLVILYIAAGLIMVRSVFRLIEYAQGNAGYLISHEAHLTTPIINDFNLLVRLIFT